MAFTRYDPQTITINENQIVNIDATTEKTYVVEGYKYYLYLQVGEINSNIEVRYAQSIGNITVMLDPNAHLTDYTFRKELNDLVITNKTNGNSVYIANYYHIDYQGYVSARIQIPNIENDITAYENTFIQIPAHADEGHIYDLQGYSTWVSGTDNSEVINTNSEYSSVSRLIDAGGGNDTINTTDAEQITVVYHEGSGNDTLNISSTTGGVASFSNVTIHIQDFTKNDLLLTFSNGNLVISNTVDNSTLTVNGYVNADNAYNWGGITFSNGERLSVSEVWSLAAKKINVVNGGSYTASLGEILNYSGGSSDDIIIGSTGSDTIDGGAGNDTLISGQQDNAGRSNTLNGGDGNDTLITFGDGDQLNGGDGNDTYIIEQSLNENMQISSINAGITDTSGLDTVIINADKYYGGSYLVDEGIENVVVNGQTSWEIIGNDLDNTFTNNNSGGLLDGGNGNDTLNGGSGSETFYGGYGNNTLIGNGGEDYFEYYIGSDAGTTNDTVIARGVDTSYINVSNYGYSTSITDLKMVKSGNDVLISNINNNNTILIKDFYVEGNAATKLILNDANWNQTVYNINDYVVAVTKEVKTGTAAADKLTVVGDVAAEYYGLAGNDTLTGGKNDDYLDGGDGTDTLIGNAGTNTLVGGLGNDTYVVSSKTDKIIENVAGGTDTVKASVDFTLASQVENLTMTANGLTGIGNELANTLTAAAGGSTLYGLAGADKLVGGAGNDYLDGGDNNDTITAGGGNNTLLGGNGNDILTGGAGINTIIGGDGLDTLTGGAGTNNMFGGLGNDTYTVISKNDTVTEYLNEGVDTVKTNVEFTLGANIENLTMLVSGQTGTGNELGNTLTAAAGGSTLYGLAGADKLVGGLGNDYLDGGDDNDTITAGGGDNTLIGGLGNDTLTGGAGINTLVGGDGADILTGGTGTNNMIGGTGNDTYTVISATDTVVENLNEGTDTVKAGVNFTLGTNVENLTMTLAGLTGNGNELINTLTAHASGSNLYGFGGNDKLVGGAGNDYLDGGEGADTITGGNGNNTMLGGAGNDSITGGTGSDDIRGGLGNDTLTGGVGSDTYHFGLGDGQDTINNTTVDTSAGRLDKLVFDSNVNADQLWFQKSGNNLVISVLNTTDKLTVTNWFTSANNHLQEIVSGDGYHLTDTQVEQLTQTMATTPQPVDGHVPHPIVDIWGFH